MYIDTHAHLNYKDYKDDLEKVIKRSQDAGIEYIINPGTDLASSKDAIELAEKFEMVYAAVGFHPHEASKATYKAIEEIEKISYHPKVVAIGEIGLDYHYNYSPQDRQRELFSLQIDIAQRRNLPIIIHSRDAETDTLKTVTEAVKMNPNWRYQNSYFKNRIPAPKGVFHSFAGNSALAWKVIKLGFFISVPGVITFKSKGNVKSKLEEVVENVSIEHILLETDSPFLTPVPHRGKRNEPAYIKYIAEKIAEIQNLLPEDIARTTNLGVYKLFNLGKYPDPTIAYQIRNSLYLNITIRCNADCWFCDRKGEALIKGYNLKINKEPTTQEVIDAIGDPKKYDEIVFCGFGEPTIRMDVLTEVAKWIKSKEGKVRLNTDGHGNIINKKNILPQLIGLVDSISISLNSTDPKQYGQMMRIDEGKYFPAMVQFAKEAVKLIGDVTMTIVDHTGSDQQKAKDFIQKEIGAKFRIRPLF